MKTITEGDVKLFLVDYFSKRLSDKGLTSGAIGNDYDLLREGVIDSIGIIEMVAEVEKHFSVSIDFEGLPAEEFTIVGPFCRYVAEQAAQRAAL